MSAESFLAGYPCRLPGKPSRTFSTASMTRFGPIISQLFITFLIEQQAIMTD